jgi:hypothetical protein
MRRVVRIPRRSIKGVAVNDDDLEVFAVADGLIAKMEQQEPGRATDAERRYMIDKARDNLVRALDVTPEQAGRIMHNAALRGDLTEQYSAQFAVITLEGRILYVLGRVALRGVCHPEHN